MKITSASKKVLASALSAAMVVAFAPTVAFGGVVADGSSSTVVDTVVSGDTVATVTYYTSKAGKVTKNVQEFKATDDASMDNALQAALAYANYVNTEAKDRAVNGTDTKTVVTLHKSVEVNAAYLQDASHTAFDDGDYISFQKVDKTFEDEVSGDKGTLFAGGVYVIDLNGNTITNASGNTNSAALTIGAHDFKNVVPGAVSYKSAVTYIDDSVQSNFGASDTAHALAALKAAFGAETAAVTTATVAGNSATIAGSVTIPSIELATGLDSDGAKAAIVAYVKTKLGATADVTCTSEGTKTAGTTTDTYANAEVTITSGTIAVKLTSDEIDDLIKAKIVKYDSKAADGTDLTISKKASPEDYDVALSTETGKVADELSGNTYVQETAGLYHKYAVDYSFAGTAIAASTGAAATSEITIVDSAEAKGAIKATNSAAIAAGASKLTIDGAAVSAASVSAITGDTNGKIHLANGASVKNEVKGHVEFGTNKTLDTADRNDIYAINTAGDVIVDAPSKAQLKANEDAYYDLGATVSAIITEGDTRAYVATGDVAGDLSATATAIKAAHYYAQRNVDVTASAEAGIDINGAGAETGTDGTTGAVTPAEKKSHSKSVAVSTGAAAGNVFEYGTYTADYAVANAGFQANSQTAANVSSDSIQATTYNSIAYGTFNGYVDANAAANAKVYGGAFKYDPANPTKDGNTVMQPALVLGDANKAYVKAAADALSTIVTPDTVDNTTYTSGKSGDMFYVYRVGTNTEGAGTASATQLSLEVPDGEKKANGSDYADFGEYLQEKYLKATTLAEVAAGTEAGTGVNDGNLAKREGNLNLKYKKDFYNPYSDANRAAKADAFAAIDKQAAENIQHVNGVYVVTGQLTYDYNKDSMGERTTTPANYGEALKSLDGVKVKYAFYPVAAGSDGKAYTISADGKTAAVESKMQDAIAAGSMVHLYATTDAMGTFGVTYSTAEDQKAQAEAKGEETVAEKATQAIEVDKKSMTVKVGSKKKTSKGKSFNIGADAETAVTAAKKSGSSKITVTSAGKVKLAKGAVKGKTYTAKVSLKAAGSDAYLAAAKTITVKFTIKK